MSVSHWQNGIIMGYVPEYVKMTKENINHIFIA
jgi:hypothetical protein